MRTTPRLALLLAVAATLGGCGRSSLFPGGTPFDCPPELILPDGTCDRSRFDFDLGIGVDAATGDLRRTDAKDGGPGDMRRPDGFNPDSGMCPGENECIANCDSPGCCNCTVCENVPFCQKQLDMKRPDGFLEDMPKGDLPDGFIDLCADKANCMLPQCVGDPRCRVLGTEVCNNGIDDDDDALVDCKDPDCVDFAGCKVMMCDENNPDCTLPICASNPKCQNLVCMPSVTFGTIQATGSSVTRPFDTTGTSDVTATACAPGGAGMVVSRFDLAAKADVTLKFTQDSGRDHVFGLFRAGTNQPCNANPVTCFDPKSATSGQTTFSGLDAGGYYLVVQPFSPQGQGKATVTLETPTVVEICNNGVDDNGNGLIDCQEGSCVSAPNCVNNQCVPDFNVGALVVNGLGKSVSFVTNGATADNDVTCEATPGAGDIVVRFTLQETAGILVDWQQSGDHVFALMRTPGPGQQCDAIQLSCFDPSEAPGGSVAWTDQPPGDYLFIFKGSAPGDEGQIDATISAFRTRKIELCGNGIDDDGNGLIDCADPSCFGVGGCGAPFCMPDFNLGTMNIGDAQSVTLNVNQDGILGYKTSCSKGDAKGMVVQFTVGGNEGVGIGFQCDMTGDQVLDLFAAGGPRDVCDVLTNELVCADPKTLPFGCGYIVPNLQPGTYNVVVQGFQPGQEGSVDLTISITNDRQLEICTNGVDDDMDGAIDCADRKCATSPACSTAKCRADAEISPVPLNGTTVTRLVQTQGGPDIADLACNVGGKDSAVIAFDLTAKANLTVGYLQLGDHAVALYSNDGNQLPCDAGTAVACVPPTGMPSGTATFNDVPSGKYYLILQAKDAASAGSVSVSVSGMPAP